MSNNYYEILGIQKTSTQDEIKKAYKKNALKWHPDRNGGSKEAEEKFKQISLAYQVLNDENKRRMYDLNGCIEDGDFDTSGMDIFNEIFQSQMNSLFSGENNMNFTVHSFTQSIPQQFNQSFPSNLNDTLRDGIGEVFNGDFKSSLKDTLKNVSKNIFQREDINNSPHSQQSFKDNNQHRIKQKKVVYLRKPPDLVFNINASLKDIYNGKMKTLKIERFRKKTKKPEKETKKVKIPLYGRTIKLEEQGNQLEGYIDNGDLVINIADIADNNFKRINYGDLITTHEITLHDIYNGCNFDIKDLNDDIIKCHLNKKILLEQDHLIQKIEGKGLPYYDEYKEKVIRGALYIKYKLILPTDIINFVDDVLNDKISNNSIEDIDKDKERIIPCNCNYDKVYSFIEA